VARPKDSAAIRTAKQEVARRIKAALALGRHSKADPNVPEPPIAPRDFAKSIGQDPSLGPKWCNEDKPSTPFYTETILRALFGDISAFAEERAELERWLCQANRRPPPDRPSSTASKTLSDYAHPVILAVNQRTPDNQGNLRIPFTLRFQYDEGWTFDAMIDGKAVSLTLDIGVARALFSVSSAHWQPAADSIFRVQREPGNPVAEGPFADSLLINGPKAGSVLVGYPFTPTRSNEDEPALVRATFERRAPNLSDADGPIIFSVYADRNDLEVMVRGPVELSGRQQDVIDAICAEPIRRDGRDRLEIARAVESSQSKSFDADR